MQIQLTLDDADLKRLQKRANRALQRPGVWDAVLEAIARVSGGVVHKREDFEKKHAKPGRPGKAKAPTKAETNADRPPQAGRTRR